MSAALWDHAPATREIKLAPVRAIVLARAKHENWQRIIGHIDALMVLPEVSAADKMTLGLERMAARVGMIACERIIAEAEAESMRQVANFQRRAGWML